MEAPRSLPPSGRHHPIVPTLSFSLSTPPDEEDRPFGADQADHDAPSPGEERAKQTRRRRPPSVTIDFEEDACQESLPLMIAEEDENAEDCCFVVSSHDEDEESTPLLSSVKGRASTPGLGLPSSPQMSRRASTQVGYSGSSSPGQSGASEGLGSSIADFLQRRASCLPSTSSGGASSLAISPVERDRPDELLVLATSLVTSAVKQAQDRVMRRASESPGLRAMVTDFVAEVLDAAKKEASAKLRENNNNAAISYNKVSGVRGVLGQGIRSNPWVNRAVRYFGSILDRICPCRGPFAKP